MKGSTIEMLTVARRLGECDVVTSVRNWSTLHDCLLITMAFMPPALVPLGKVAHRDLDLLFDAACPNPLEAENPDAVCMVRITGSALLSLVACIDKAHDLVEGGEVLLLGMERTPQEMKAQISGAAASFQEYLRSRDVGAEILFGRER